MMKRSEFAQKLLDDLRVRKEQLSVSDNSAYSNRGFKGSKETRAKSTATSQDLNYGGAKSLTGGTEASKQIVPYGKGRSMEKTDLSKALAFALENAGKATRADPCGNASIISFLHEVGKRSLEYGTSERRSIQQLACSSSTPMIHVHIKEISKGAQKLNKIIKACSNGLSFRKGRYSIQCGENLMEGAIELEQSLRLLVDIQQASSEYITKKQRKTRIKLLEENEEEEALLELSYPRDKNNKHTRQTSSCDDTEQRSVTPQKGRIPSVVAKLMGLGEFPENEKESQNNKDASIKSAENLTRRRVIQKAQMSSTSSDLVIHKETQTGNDINHEAKDGPNIRKRNKKNGEIMKKNIITSPTEDRHKVVARRKQKPLHKPKFENKLVLHDSEEKRSVEKDKMQRERQKVDGVTTNHPPKSSSLVDMQNKLQLTAKAKALRKSTFSQVQVSHKEKEGEMQEPPEKQRSNCTEADEKHNKLLTSYKHKNQMKREADTCINSPEFSGVEVQASDSILLITAERVLCEAPPANHHGIMFTDVMDQSDGHSERESKTVYKGTKGEVEADLPLLEKPIETKEVLSESETNIKKIVLKSQLFLDTAEAHFKLNIPLSVLHDAGGSNYNQEDKNLILDCGYELMKRRGRFQELSVHPFVKAPIISSKVNSLDNLVRQLSKEFEKLRVYGRDCHTGSLVEDYLPKVLERDVHYKDPNLNSMWDMGWNDLMLAFIEKDDVIRDIEREIFIGLLEEITRDLICI